MFNFHSVPEEPFPAETRRIRGGTWLILANCSNFPTISPASPAPTRLFGPLKARDSDLMEAVCVAPARRPGLLSGRGRERACRTSKSPRTGHANDLVTPSIPVHRAINPARNSRPFNHPVLPLKWLLPISEDGAHAGERPFCLSSGRGGLPGCHVASKMGGSQLAAPRGPGPQAGLPCRPRGCRDGGAWCSGNVNPGAMEGVLLLPLTRSGRGSRPPPRPCPISLVPL